MPLLALNTGRTGDPRVVFSWPADGPAAPLRDAAVVIDEVDGTVAWIGAAADAPAADSDLDIGGRAMLPGWVDSHTHLLFAGDRAAEFAARMAGEPYAAGDRGRVTG